MRELKFLSVILAFSMLLGLFSACNPENSSSESSTPAHTCESVCEECGKCLDADCTEEACEDKCAGHTVEPAPTHTCESKCPTCNKCTDTTCTEEVCADKCAGHTVEPAPEVPSNDTQATFATFEQTGEYEYSLKVSNATETLALDALVTVHASSAWTLSSDENGNETIAEKIAALVVGDNTYYVLVRAEDNSTQLYTLKIRRKPIYTVTFDVAGGTSVNAQEVEEGGLAWEPETMKEGYDFSGWNYDFTTPITENKTIVASWTEIEYTISYNLNGGSVATNNPETYYIESGEITLTNPTREGCQFVGWTGTGVNEPTMSVIIYTGSTGNREYVANWEYEEYTITYHLNGGTNSNDNPTNYTVDTADITLVAPTQSGYEFGGWYKTSDFDANSRISVITKGSLGNLNLYAKWTAETPEVDNLPNVTVTQTLSQYVTNRDYASISAYTAFTNVAQPAYVTPGLMEGLIPQGLDVWEDKDLLLISAYFDGKNTSGSPTSMIVAVDLKTGNLAGKYCLKNIDGSNHTGHVGGLAVTEKNIFISSGRALYRIPLSQMERLGKSGTLQFVETIKIAALGSFCNYSDGVLWVGDFVNTTETPVLPTVSVSTYTAWAVGYKVKDTESEFSSENWDSSTMDYATPDYALSITNKVQGLAFTNGKVALSTSYGRSKNSKLYVYNSPLQSTQDASITVNGKSVPVWVLDGTYLNKSYTLMPMAEGASSYNGKLLLVFESGTRKYYNATNPTDHVWSVTMPE